MKISQEEITRELYNLILNTGTREWERSILIATKNALENHANFENQLAKLESELRPLALRNNLTPDVTDFYLRVTDNSVITTNFDLSKHFQEELEYQDRAIFGGGCTGHVEGVEIIFDTRIISYEQLVALYWEITDPTDSSGQFQDRGTQCRPLIFVRNAHQKEIAEASKKRLVDSGKYKQPIVTEIQPISIFWPAENYHQQFYKKQPKRYKRINVLGNS